jgi:hypothetical protein
MLTPPLFDEKTKRKEKRERRKKTVEEYECSRK